MAEHAACRSCGATVYWVTTKAGKLMPVDPPGTHPNPNLEVWRDPTTGELRLGNPHPDATTRRTTSHFATCDDADDWRTRDTL